LGIVAGLLLACGDGAGGGAGAGPSARAPEASGGTANTGINPDDGLEPGVDLGGGATSSGTPTGAEGGRVGEGNPPVAGIDANDGEDGPPGGAGTGTGQGEPEPLPTDCLAVAPASALVGYGAATTGGGNAAAVVVESFAEAEAALAAYRDAFDEGTASALVLRFAGSFDYATITDVCAQHTLDPQVLEIKEMENVTFEGAPGSSANFGIHINRAKNVIVRNMTLGLLPGGDGSDAITIEGNGTNGDVENVWIDHNELFSSTKDDCDGAGDTEFDGLIDIKKGARFITISYNYLHDHQKTGLLGFSDSDDTDRYVTFHHNRYENVVSRTPLQRFGFVHIFNNYYGSILGSGINVRMGGVALIESNFFENAANPVTSRFTDVVGFWDLRNNHVGAGITWTTESDTLANAEDWQSTTTFPAEELSYDYTPDVAACVKQIVLASAGATL
jgi:pectate lyase